MTPATGREWDESSASFRERGRDGLAIAKGYRVSERTYYGLGRRPRVVKWDNARGTWQLVRSVRRGVGRK